MPTFDLDQFTSSPVGAMETDFERIPEGDWRFMIDTNPEMLQPKEIKGEGEKGPYHFFNLELTCVCQDESVKAKMQRDRVTAVMRVRLDLDLTAAEAGKLVFEEGKNKNVALGQLRAALGQNTPGWSPKMLLGAGPFLGKVTHQKTDRGTFVNIVRASPIR